MKPRRILGDDGKPKGWRCPECLTLHMFPLYVYAHWDLRLTHTCTTKGCKVRVALRAGIVTRIASLG